MSTKEKIIEKINHIDDESLLEDVLEMLNSEISIVEKVQLSEAQKKAIDVGLKDIEEGRVHSDADARKIIDEWMKDK